MLLEEIKGRLSKSRISFFQSAIDEETLQFSNCNVIQCCGSHFLVVINWNSVISLYIDFSFAVHLKINRSFAYFITVLQQKEEK